jgi:hypothetical protein
VFVLLVAGVAAGGGGLGGAVLVLVGLVAVGLLVVGVDRVVLLDALVALARGAVVGRLVVLDDLCLIRVGLLGAVALELVDDREGLRVAAAAPGLAPELDPPSPLEVPASPPSAVELASPTWSCSVELWLDWSFSASTELSCSTLCSPSGDDSPEFAASLSCSTDVELSFDWVVPLSWVCAAAVPELASPPRVSAAATPVPVSVMTDALIPIARRRRLEVCMVDRPFSERCCPEWVSSGFGECRSGPTEWMSPAGRVSPAAQRSRRTTRSVVASPRPS